MQNPLVEIQITKRDDGSQFYRWMKDYQKTRVFKTRKISIERNYLKFSSNGYNYQIELDSWDVSINPIQ